MPSPDGTRLKVLHKGSLVFASAWGWLRGSSTLFLAYLPAHGRVSHGRDGSHGITL